MELLTVAPQSAGTSTVELGTPFAINGARFWRTLGDLLSRRRQPVSPHTDVRRAVDVNDEAGLAVDERSYRISLHLDPTRSCVGLEAAVERRQEEGRLVGGERRTPVRRECGEVGRRIRGPDVEVEDDGAGIETDQRHGPPRRSGERLFLHGHADRVPAATTDHPGDPAPEVVAGRRHRRRGGRVPVDGVGGGVRGRHGRGRAVAPDAAHPVSSTRAVAAMAVAQARDTRPVYAVIRRARGRGGFGHLPVRSPGWAFNPRRTLGDPLERSDVAAVRAGLSRMVQDELVEAQLDVGAINSSNCADETEHRFGGRPQQHLADARRLPASRRAGLPELRELSPHRCEQRVRCANATPCGPDGHPVTPMDGGEPHPLRPPGGDGQRKRALQRARCARRLVCRVMRRPH